MNTYTVKQLAELTGITIRTLHHYDEIDLLKPSTRTEADYRLYEQKDLLRLQQILLYKEMGFALAEIKQLLDDPEYQLEEALHEQKRFLLTQQEKYEQLINTIDKTLRKIQEQDELVTDQELYEGFTPEQIERYNKEAEELYGDKYYESQKRVRQMTKAEWEEVKKKGDEVTKALAQLIHEDPSHPEVQKLIAEHRSWVEHFYEVPKELYRGLGNLYVENPEFTAFYNKHAPGLAQFMRKAMHYYCDHSWMDS